MATNDTIYRPETIESIPFPETVSDDSSAYSRTPSEVVKVPVNVAVRFPPKSVARELVSDSLNTQSKKILGEYTFGELGAFSVGKYVSGVSGEVKFSPSGIVAKNSAGVTTFSLDGDTGDASFAGTLTTGSILSGDIDITGTLIINDGANDIILIGYQSGGF